MDDWQVVENMERWGGSFVKCLAELYRLGDASNRYKIKQTWPNYWERYSSEEWQQGEKE